MPLFPFVEILNVFFFLLPSSFSPSSSSYSSGGLPSARAPSFFDRPLRYIFPRKRFDLEIDRARSESKVEVALFLPPPPLVGRLGHCGREKRRSYFTRASHGKRYPFSLFFLVRGASWKREMFRFWPGQRRQVETLSRRMEKLALSSSGNPTLLLLLFFFSYRRYYYRSPPKYVVSLPLLSIQFKFKKKKKEKWKPIKKLLFDENKKKFHFATWKK